jgi:glycerol-3-phosphate dehydrogenase
MIKPKLYQVGIIGGGIIGLGIAASLAKMGCRTVLLERRRCGGGASANSHRIIHGGFRYLKDLNIRRVMESARAQALTRRRFAESVSPLSCYLPLKESGLESARAMRFALSLYHLLTGSPAGRGKVLSPREIIFPSLLSGLSDSTSFLLWFDLFLQDHQRVVQSLVEMIHAGSGEVREGEEVKSADSTDSCTRLFFQGLSEPLDCEVIINATGANIQQVGELFGGTLFPEVRWCRAFNLVLKSEGKTGSGWAVKSKEGRLYFLVERPTGLAVGTEYLPLDGVSDSVEITGNEQQNFLSDVSHAVPSELLANLEIMSVEKGVLPIKGWKDRTPLLYGSEEVRTRGKYLEVLSTKYTTFLVVGEKVSRIVRRILR